jgi:hypothetical protein
VGTRNNDAIIQYCSSVSTSARGMEVRGNQLGACWFGEMVSSKSLVEVKHIREEEGYASMVLIIHECLVKTKCIFEETKETFSNLIVGRALEYFIKIK